MGIKSRENYAPCQNMTQDEFDRIFKKDEESEILKAFDKEVMDSIKNIKDFSC